MGILIASTASTGNVEHLCGTIMQYLHIRKGENASIKADYNSLITITVPHQGASNPALARVMCKLSSISRLLGEIFFSV